MKTRIIAAAVLIPVLFLLVLVVPKIAAAIVFGLLLAIGAYELLYRTGLVRNVRMVFYSAVAAFALSIWSYYDSIRAYLLIGMVIFCMLLFSEMMIDHIKVQVEMVGLCILAGFMIPYMLCALIRILSASEGRSFILLPFTIAFLSDAGAYFVGLRFGRHKLAPVVSPNKTIEGMGGGILFAIIGVLVYSLILRFALHLRVNFALAILYGFLGSLSGVMGDLCFSVIKRQTGIKDYGNLIPGHGGFLDRFDSLVMVAPLIEALLLLFPLAV